MLVMLRRVWPKYLHILYKEVASRLNVSAIANRAGGPWASGTIFSVAPCVIFSSQRIPRQSTLHWLGRPKALNLLQFPDTVTKKWVIITEISKEVENNAIARLNVYAKQYVPGRTGAAGGSSGGGGSSGRSWIFPPCVYTFVCVEIKTKREEAALCILENV